MVPGENYVSGGLTLGLMGVINGIMDLITGERIAVLLPDSDGQPVLGFQKYCPGVRYD